MREFKRSKWYREIIAYAHGARIQIESENQYYMLQKPIFHNDIEHRIHPEDEPYFGENGMPKIETTLEKEYRVYECPICATRAGVRAGNKVCCGSLMCGYASMRPK